MKRNQCHLQSPHSDDTVLRGRGYGAVVTGNGQVVDHTNVTTAGPSQRPGCQGPDLLGMQQTRCSDMQNHLLLMRPGTPSFLAHAPRNHMRRSGDRKAGHDRWTDSDRIRWGLPTLRQSLTHPYPPAYLPTCVFPGIRAATSPRLPHLDHPSLPHLDQPIVAPSDDRTAGTVDRHAVHSEPMPSDAPQVSHGSSLRGGDRPLVELRPKAHVYTSVNG
jgi:hypothetical protein